MDRLAIFPLPYDIIRELFMKRFLFVPVLLLLSACGSIMHGSTQTLYFESNVPGTHISGPSVSCVTPCEISVKRHGEPLALTAQKQGYKTVQGTINTSFSLFFILGTTTGNVYSTTTDLLTGSMFKYDEDKYFFDMVPENIAEESKTDKIRRYVLTNYTQIQQEFYQKAPGEYLTELSLLTQIDADDLIEMNENQSATEYVNAVLKHGVSGKKASAQNKEEEVQYTSWVELYEKEGYIGQTDRNQISYIGYGEASSFQEAKNAAVKDAYNKACMPITGMPDGSIKVALKGLRLFSEYKHQSKRKFKVWLLYRYPKAQLEQDIREYKKSKSAK